MSKAIAFWLDWNAELVTDAGKYTPAWLVSQVPGLRIFHAGSGRHGNIDGAVADCDIRQMRRIRGEAFGHGSDHDPVIGNHHQPNGPGVLRGGTWNVLRDRKPGTVKAEVVELLHSQSVDFLCVQEAGDYWTALHAIDGYSVVGSRQKRGQSDQLILVRDGVDVARPKVVPASRAGWFTVRGGLHPRLWFTSAVLGGWLRAVCGHLPPSVNWRKRRPRTIYGPPMRVACLIQGVRTVLTWARANRNSRR